MSQYNVPQMSRFEQGDPYMSTANELLHDDLFPEDAYADEVYWADLPRRERITWVNNQSNREAARELKVLAAEFRRDPLQPFRDYFSKYVIVGLGLFVEGYTLFSVGNIDSLFEAVWPQCWKTFQVCNAKCVAS